MNDGSRWSGFTGPPSASCRVMSMDVARSSLMRPVSPDGGLVARYVGAVVDSARPPVVRHGRSGPGVLEKAVGAAQQPQHGSNRGCNCSRAIRCSAAFELRSAPGRSPTPSPRVPRTPGTAQVKCPRQDVRKATPPSVCTAKSALTSCASSGWSGPREPDDAAARRQRSDVDMVEQLESGVGRAAQPNSRPSASAACAAAVE